MLRSKPLTPRTLDELRKREADRGEPYKRLRAHRATAAILISTATGDVNPLEEAAPTLPPPTPRSVSTGRTPGAARDKLARLTSRAWLDTVKRDRCERCGNPADDPHHTILVGRRGDECDLSAVPLCRPCHNFIHNTTMPREDRERLLNELLGSWLRRKLPTITRGEARRLFGDFLAGIGES